MRNRDEKSDKQQNDSGSSNENETTRKPAEGYGSSTGRSSGSTERSSVGESIRERGMRNEH